MNKIIFIVISMLVFSTRVFNPMLLTLVLVLLSCVMGIYLYLSVSIWMMNVLIMVFLGGMMILFIYVATLSNDKKLFLFQGQLMSMLWVFAFLGAPTEGHSYEGWSYSYKFNSLSSLFEYSSIGILVFLISSLLLSLFVTIKLSESNKGALLKM